MAAADEDDITGLHELSSEDEDYSYDDDVSDNDTSLPANVSGRKAQYSKKNSRNKIIYSTFCVIIYYLLLLINIVLYLRYIFTR